MSGNDTAASEEAFVEPLLQLVAELQAEIQPDGPAPAPSLDSSLDRDLGLDSLARVELMARIERRFGLTLPESAYVETETPRDILRELLRAGVQRRATPAAAARPRAREGAGRTPDRAQTLAEVLDWHVEAHPERPHIQLYSDEGDGEVIDYGQLREGALKVARGLQGLGLQAGQAVAIMLPTGPDYFYTFFGILLAGGVPVPIYPPARLQQLEDHLRRHARILGNCRAPIMITVGEARAVARLLKSQLETLRHLVTVEEVMGASGGFRRPDLSPRDTAFLQYTSGSTGDPKGVILSHANLLANIRAMGERVRANADDVFVSWLPLYHDMGLIGAWLGSLYFGALFVVMSPLAFLARPQRWLQAIHRHRGTLSASPNFGYQLCLHRLQDEDLQGLDLSCWRAAFNGAEPISPDTVQRFPERLAPHGFPATSMMPVYGLAECSVGLAFPPPGRGVRIDRIRRRPFMADGRALPASAEDDSALRFVACGQVLAGHEIRIVDSHGNALPERREGRLQFRGPSATSGYFHNPQATQALFDGDWLDSGDLAYLSDGDLFITGRSKDIIIRAGRNLYPHELEEAVGDIDGIRTGRVAVFGAGDPRTGTERLVVLAETRATDSATLAALRQQINAVATALIDGPPDDIVLAPPGTVLKTSSGKIRRSACRELYERGEIGKGRPGLWRQVSHLLLSGIRTQLRGFLRGFAARAWSVYAAAMFWCLAPVSWLLVVVLPRRAWRWKAMRGATRLLLWLTRTPLRVEGRENLPAADQACIYVANHASYLDGPLLIAALRRPFSFVAKIELSRQFIAGTFLRRIETEFVERFDVKRGVADTRHLSRAAGDGRSLLFFPEGTFTRQPGLLPFHLGAFLVAAQRGLPVVPVAIRGSRTLLPGTSRLPQRSSLTIVIGKPISVDEVRSGEDREPWDIALALRDAARAHIRRHCGEADAR